MSLADITAAVWRRRVLFAVTLLGCIAVVALITAVIPKVYRATATVYVGTDTPNLGSDQGEQLSRTYTTLAGNANIAQGALDALHLPLTRQGLLDKMSFTPVERTQLLEIGAEDHSPQQATRIANTYANVFAAQVNAQHAQGRAPASVAVSQAAVLPTSPVKPKPAIYLGIGTLLSILIAAAVCVVRDRFDRRIRVGKRDDTVEGEVILARIPTLLGASADGADGQNDRFARAARIMRSDAFRVLRTNLELAGEEPARTIMVTSPGEGEGKTTVAAQLALTVATDRERVAIVECDLRRRGLDVSGFGRQMRRSEFGLSEYLDARTTLKQIVTPVNSMPDMSVIWAGRAVAEPGPLLRSPRLAGVIATLQRDNDWVIIDTPPIAVGDDALIISGHADGVLVVVDAENTTGPALEAGMIQLRMVRAHVLGVVVNHAPPAELDAYRYLTDQAPQTPPVRQRQTG